MKGTIFLLTIAGTLAATSQSLPPSGTKIDVTSSQVSNDAQADETFVNIGTITFDDLIEDQVLTTYRGLVWTNFKVSSTSPSAPSLPLAAIPTSTTSSLRLTNGTFSLISVDLAGARNAGPAIIRGFDSDGVEIVSTTVPLTRTYATSDLSDFENLSELEFEFSVENASGIDNLVFESSQPTISISSIPSNMPSLLPSKSLPPSATPSQVSSSMPSATPSQVSSASPSQLPSETLEFPSESPSSLPSEFPSDAPSDMPSQTPSSTSIVSVVNIGTITFEDLTEDQVLATYHGLIWTNFKVSSTYPSAPSPPLAAVPTSTTSSVRLANGTFSLISVDIAGSRNAGPVIITGFDSDGVQTISTTVPLVGFYTRTVNLSDFENLSELEFEFSVANASAMDNWVFA
eukprot:scaffold5780_cov102-Cylindrotheca_fusiformis.AAC.2